MSKAAPILASAVVSLVVALTTVLASSQFAYEQDVARDRREAYANLITAAQTCVRVSRDDYASAEAEGHDAARTFPRPDHALTLDELKTSGLVESALKLFDEQEDDQCGGEIEAAYSKVLLLAPVRLIAAAGTLRTSARIYRVSRLERRYIDVLAADVAQSGPSAALPTKEFAKDAASYRLDFERDAERFTLFAGDDVAVGGLQTGRRVAAALVPIVFLVAVAGVVSAFAVALVVRRIVGGRSDEQHTAETNEP